MIEKSPEKADANLHAGHRKRMKNLLLLESGKLAEHQLLEILLYFSVPRIDTNELAHRLISECGSLKDVVYASPEKLMSVKGIGENTATQIILLREIYKSINRNKFKKRDIFDTLTKVGEFAISYFDGDRKERVSAMLFDSKMHLIDVVELSRGSANSAPFDTRELARVALLHDSTRVVLAHNHPSGELSPSIADRLATQSAESALQAVGVTLIEHLVVGEVGYTPMMQMRLGFFLKSDKNDPKTQFYKHFYSN